MVTLTRTLLLTTWLPGIFGFPPLFQSTGITSDEDDYSYGGIDVDLFDSDDNEFSGEIGSGETVSFSQERFKQRSFLNIEEAEELSSLDKNYLSYLDVIYRLNRTVNYTADPCTDFFEYACGNSKRETDVFEEIEQQNDWKIIETLENFEFQNDKNSFVNKAKAYYESCVASYVNPGTTSTSIDVFQSILLNFSTITGLQFPAAENVNSLLNPTILALAVAILNSLHVDTFITPSIIHQNDGEALFFIDQSSLYYPLSNYNRTGDQEMEVYRTNIVKTLSQYFRLMNINVEENEVIKIAKEIIVLEMTMAREYTTSEILDDECYTTKECYINNFSNYVFIDFSEYFRTLSKQSKFIRNYFSADDRPVLARKYIMQKMNDNFYKVFKPEVIVNYMFYRLIMSRRSYFLTLNGHCSMCTVYNSCMTTNNTNNRRLNTERTNKNDRHLKIEQSMDDDSGDLAAKWKCLQQMKSDIPEVADRFDVVNISSKQQHYMDRYLNNLLKNIRFSLINMLRLTLADDDESFNMLTEELNKVKIVVRYPSDVNDEVLNMRYNDLNIENTDNFYVIHEKLLQYNFLRRYESLSNQATNGQKIERLMYADDIFYDYTEHKIAIAFTLLKKPFFDVDWPESVVYGTLGFAFGHELIHSFADIQQRYPWNVNTKKLLDKQQDMEKCLIHQYKGYCPLNNTNARPKCIDSFSSLPENMADNGGIIAAYLAYQTQAALYGRDPQLPHSLFSKFTHDQLFFIGFAQTFCHRPLHEHEWLSMLLDTPAYSPQKYRVLGPLANFAAFKNAFNCPITAEDEAKHCYTWIPKLEDTLV